MSEWQPARWKAFHSRPQLSDADRRKWESLVVKVRPINARPTQGTYGAKMSDCNATKFYEVQGCEIWLICEHEILTD